MGYAPTQVIRYKSNSIDEPIRNSGFFREGTYEVVVHAEWDDNNKRLVVKFTDATKDTHTEYWELQGNSFRGFRAACWPDLEWQMYIDTLGPEDVAHVMCGCMCTIMVVRTEGYNIIRDKNEYAAIDEHGNVLVPFTASLDTVKRACISNGWKKSYHTVYKIECNTKKEMERIYKNFSEE